MPPDDELTFRTLELIEIPAWLITMVLQQQQQTTGQRRASVRGD